MTVVKPWEMNNYYKFAIYIIVLMAFVCSGAISHETEQNRNSNLINNTPAENGAYSLFGINNPASINIIKQNNFFKSGRRQDQNSSNWTEYSRPKEESISFGIFADYGFNYHNADFKELNGVPNCCTEFRYGSGTGASLGLLLDVPFTSRSSLTFRGGIFSYSGKLKATSSENIIINDSLIFAEIEHGLDARLFSLSIEPLFSYKFIKNFAVLAGLNAGYVFKRSFDQKETLIEPENRGAFENGKRVRNESSGDIPDISKMFLFVDFGLSYDLALNRFESFILSPEFLYSYGLNNITSSTAWTVNVLRFGLSLKFRPLPDYSSPLKP